MTWLVLPLRRAEEACREGSTYGVLLLGFYFWGSDNAEERERKAPVLRRRHSVMLWR
jgi:hypothetical protein